MNVTTWGRDHYFGATFSDTFASRMALLHAPASTVGKAIAGRSYSFWYTFFKWQLLGIGGRTVVLFFNKFAKERSTELASTIENPCTPQLHSLVVTRIGQQQAVQYLINGVAATQQFYVKTLAVDSVKSFLNRLPKHDDALPHLLSASVSGKPDAKAEVYM